MTSTYLRLDPFYLQLNNLLYATDWERLLQNSLKQKRQSKTLFSMSLTGDNSKWISLFSEDKIENCDRSITSVLNLTFVYLYISRITLKSYESTLHTSTDNPRYQCTFQTIFVDEIGILLQKSLAN